MRLNACTAAQPLNKSQTVSMQDPIQNSPAGKEIDLCAELICAILNASESTYLSMEVTPPKDSNKLPNTIFKIVVERVCSCERCAEKRDEYERLKALDDEEFDPIIHVD